MWYVPMNSYAGLIGATVLLSFAVYLILNIHPNGKQITTSAKPMALPINAKRPYAPSHFVKKRSDIATIRDAGIGDPRAHEILTVQGTIVKLYLNPEQVQNWVNLLPG